MPEPASGKKKADIKQQPNTNTYLKIYHYESR